MNKFIMSFLGLSVMGLFLGGSSQAQGMIRYVQWGNQCRVYQVVGTKWNLIRTVWGSCSQYNQSSTQSSNSSSIQPNVSYSNSSNSNMTISSSGSNSVHNVPFPYYENSIQLRVGYIWEYYPQNLTCHLVRYIEYLNRDPSIYDKYRYTRQVIEGYSNIGYNECGLKSIYSKTIYTSVNLNDSRWKWGYNHSNRQWQWNYQ